MMRFDETSTMSKGIGLSAGIATLLVMASAAAQVPPPAGPPGSAPPPAGAPPAAAPPPAAAQPGAVPPPGDPPPVAPPPSSAPPPQYGAAPPPSGVSAGPGNAMLGGSGESCRARSDCQAGLACFDGVCRDENEGRACGATAECGGTLRCIDNVCQGPDGGGSSGSGGFFDGFKLEGAHPFVGIDLAGGPSMPLAYANGSTLDVSGSFLMALKGGVFIDSTELGVEFSPFTSFWYTDSDFGPSLSLMGYFAQHIPMSDNFYWPIRIGFGMIAGNTPGDYVYFQQRFDLIGLTYRYENLMFDFHLPSFRHGTDFDNLSVFVWQPGVATSMVF